MHITQRATVKAHPGSGKHRLCISSKLLAKAYLILSHPTARTNTSAVKLGIYPFQSTYQLVFSKYVLCELSCAIKQNTSLNYIAFRIFKIRREGKCQGL